MSAKIKASARGLAALGRGKDKMLVHMTPGEVAGLQKLAIASGGSLTVNPKTGLVEAGWLSTLLPMVAAGAATIMSGGTLAPAMAALYGGGAGALGAKLEGGDPLSGAMFGALGGLGGSGIAGGLSNAGKAALTAPVTQQVGTTAMPALGQAGAMPPLQSAGAMSIPNTVTAGMPSAAVTGPQSFNAGLKGLAEKGAIANLWKEMSPTAKLGTGATALALADSFQNTKSPKTSNPMYLHTTGNINPVSGITTFGPGYWSKEYDYANRGMYDPDNEIPDYETRKKAAGGLMGLAKGGYVKGKGDGVSDSIPAMIKDRANKQQAVLSNNEFVVPARHVAEIGNGSSDAGAQRLYAMLHRIEQRRRGTPFDTDSGAYKELPA